MGAENITDFYNILYVGIGMATAIGLYLAYTVYDDFTEVSELTRGFDFSDKKVKENKTDSIDNIIEQNETN